MTAVRRWLPWAASAFLVALTLSVLDHRGSFWLAFMGYLMLALVSAVILAIGWQVVGEDRSPSSLSRALAAAVIIRLLLGTGLFFGLPALGYDTKPNQQGYLYYDAYARDTDAYARGRSDKPLLSAFEDRKSSDQYGGLLFVSAAVYRYLSEGPHRPLMLVVLAASISSLAVLFTWGFTAILFGSRVGKLAAWIVALYPDYVLLGSSQMREAFFVPGLASAFYCFSRLRLGDRRGGLVFIGIGVAFAMFISPPYGLVALLLVGLLWIVTARFEQRDWLLPVIAGVVILILALVLTVQAWSAIPGLPRQGPIGLLAGWLTRGAEYQVAELEAGSGWIQSLFALTPEWSHTPIATFYGLTLPFLPAAIADISGVALWQTIAIYRALGWFLLLPPLIYGSLAALRADKGRPTLLLIALVVWVTAVLGSYRAGGDLWDNPRYRAAFIFMQAILAAWAWAAARMRGSPWLRRLYVALIGSNLIFLHWYIGRYFGTPRLPLLATMVLAAVFAVGYVSILWWQDTRKT